jgi:HK97 family phage prohead protease
VENKSYVLADVKALEDEHPNGSFEVILSTPTRDRQGEVVGAKAFEPLPASIPAHIDHITNYSNLVGRAVPRYEGDILVAKGNYTASPLAQALRQDVKEGNVTHVSVGFANGVRKSLAGEKTVTKGELVEFSFVTVPANAHALILAAKALGDEDLSWSQVQSEAAAFVAELEQELAS